MSNDRNDENLEYAYAAQDQRYPQFVEKMDRSADMLEGMPRSRGTGEKTKAPPHQTATTPTMKQQTAGGSGGHSVIDYFFPSDADNDRGSAHQAIKNRWLRYLTYALSTIVAGTASVVIISSVEGGMEVGLLFITLLIWVSAIWFIHD